MKPSKTSRLRKPQLIAASLLASLTIASAGVAVAAGPGRGPAGGPPGGPPGPGAMIDHVLATMKDRLALDSSQQVAFDRISEQMKVAHEQAAASRAEVRARLDAELAKAEPDLAAVSAIADSAEDQGRAARRQIRDQWIGFYANLRPDQKTIVRDAIRDRVASMGEMRQHMRERMQRRPS